MAIEIRVTRGSVRHIGRGVIRNLLKNATGMRATVAVAEAGLCVLRTVTIMTGLAVVPWAALLIGATRVPFVT